MFYDETQKQWIVDTMEISNENNDLEQSDESDEDNVAVGSAT